MTATTAATPSSDILTNAAGMPCQTCDSGQTLTTRGLCCRDFRSTLGNFATGITVITALAENGEAVGVTISSFNSVSLEPPLILWSLALNSPSLDVFRNASHYAVNVLSAEQQNLSDRFASRSADRFAGISQRPGLGGAPLLDGCCAWFECSNEAHYPGGDHLILVGHVERFEQGDAPLPLIFHGGRYRRLDTPKPD